MENNIPPKKLWFKAKTYGYGWTPATWEGWLVILIFVLILVADMKIFLPFENENLIPFIAIEIVSVSLLTWISFKKGEKLRWHWGKDVDQ